jgi:hypothetical protein
MGREGVKLPKHAQLVQGRCFLLGLQELWPKEDQPALPFGRKVEPLNLARMQGKDRTLSALDSSEIDRMGAAAGRDADDQMELDALRFSQEVRAGSPAQH